jgi:hypothetical protein
MILYYKPPNRPKQWMVFGCKAAALIASLDPKAHILLSLKPNGCPSHIISQIKHFTLAHGISFMATNPPFGKKWERPF